MRRMFAGVFASTLVLATAASAAEPLPHEARWLARWGLSADDRNDKVLLEKSKVGSRLAEAIAAGRSGDQVAAVLVRLELERRCFGEKRVGRADCAALAGWGKTMHFAGNMPQSSATSTVYRYWPPRSPRLTEIGKMFDLGVGGPADPKVAEFFYEAALLGDASPQTAEANYRMGLLWEEGRLGRVDKQAARKHYSAAGEQGHAVAAYLMATTHLAEGSKDSAAHFFRQAADAGVADAAYRYAHMLETGEVKSPGGAKKLFTYYQKAALAGHVPSISGVARAYSNGWGVPANDALAEEWWSRAARAGDPEAAWTVAAIYSRRGDHPGGLPYLRQAAAGGRPGAQDTLNSWLAKGVRERSLGNTMLSVLEFVGDLGAEMERQRQAEIAVQQAQASEFANALAASGYWTEEAMDARFLDYFGENAAAANGGGSAAEGYLTIEEGDRPVEYGQTPAERPVYKSSPPDDTWKKRRDAALIACHGSLEAAARAKASCQ